MAYLIPVQPSHDLLDSLIAECQSRWGGRRTPLIPTNGDDISNEYWSLLELWDADIIYSFVKISDRLYERLSYRFAPAEISLHPETASSWPQFNGQESLLQATSLLPLFSRRAQMRGNALPQIIDTNWTNDSDNDFADSFGSPTASRINVSLLPHAHRFQYSIESSHYRSSERITLDDIEQYLGAITDRSDILSLNLLSDLFCGHIYPLAKGHESWNNHFTIVVGDEPEDRLLFWAAQHKYKSLDSLADTPVIRLSKKRFEKGCPNWLRKWASIRNRRHLNGNQAPRTLITSNSLSNEELEKIASLFGNIQGIMILTERRSPEDIFSACAHAVKDKENHIGFNRPLVWSPLEVKQTNRYEHNEIHLPLIKPYHLTFTPDSALSIGVWAVDLSIERNENHSRYSNRPHLWLFPRRLRLDQSVDINSPEVDRRPHFPYYRRPNALGDLTVWDCSQWSRPSINLPTDFSAFRNAVLFNYWRTAPQDRHHPIKNFSEINVSDKGRDLLGVLQLFRSLPEALVFLTNPYWLEVIAKLSLEEPAKNLDKIKALETEIKNGFEKENETKINYEWLARRSLELASRTYLSSSQSAKVVTFEGLLSWAKETAKSVLENGKQVSHNTILSQLPKSTAYLRDRDFLRQGHGWKCPLCQHNNWVSLEDLKPIQNCEVCKIKESAPVSTSFHFRLNPFVQHAFNSTSAQDSVAWCLDNLYKRSKNSFCFIPSIDVFDINKNDASTDIDLLASVDGVVYLAEVKSSASGITDREMAKLLKLAQATRPNVILLGVYSAAAQLADKTTIFREMREKLKELDVEFEVLSRKDHEKTHTDWMFPSAYGQEMIWSAW
ncbi:MAG: hypothetical protein ACK4GK_17215 [Ferrovibrio sp.]